LKRYILPVLIFVLVANVSAQVADPGRTPTWDRFKAYLQNGTMTFSYKTLASPTITGTATNSGTFKIVGNSAATNFYVVSDADSFKVRMFKYLYPIEMEIGNVQKFAVDSAGNAIFAGTVSAAAFSPTTSSSILAHDVYTVSDGDSVWMDPHQNVYPFKVAIGGVKMAAVDSAGKLYAVSMSTPTIAATAITGSALGATAVNTKLTIGGNYPFVMGSLMTADSVALDHVSGLAATNSVEVKAKLTIAANYPLVSSSGITADTLAATGGNAVIIDVDTVATAGGVSRWLVLKISKAGATGKPANYYMVADTTSLY
jgi:hypothetical protein